jgi:hypothetical protein
VKLYGEGMFGDVQILTHEEPSTYSEFVQGVIVNLAKDAILKEGTI